MKYTRQMETKGGGGVRRSRFPLLGSPRYIARRETHDPCTIFSPLVAPTLHRCPAIYTRHGRGRERFKRGQRGLELNGQK